MAANKDLIAMARDVAKAYGFNDIGKIVDENIQSVISNVEGMVKARQESKAKTDEYLRSYLHNLPNANMQKIPEYMRAEVTSKVQEAHREYGKAARVAATLSPSDEGYAEAVQVMNGVKQKFQALDASFNQLADWKTSQLKAAEDGVFSNGNNPVDREFNASVATDQAEFKIGDDFQIQFMRKDAKQAGLNMLYTGMGQKAINPSEQWLGLSQLPKSSYVDEDFQKEIIGLMTKYQNNRVPMNEESKSLLRSQVSLILGNDRDSIVSAATDSPIDGSDVFAFSDELIQDPSKTQELREQILDSYVDTIFSGAENAYDQGQAAKIADKKLENKYRIRTNNTNNNNFSYDQWLLLQSMKNNGGVPDDNTPDTGASSSMATTEQLDNIKGYLKSKSRTEIDNIIDDIMKANGITKDNGGRTEVIQAIMTPEQQEAFADMY